MERHQHFLTHEKKYLYSMIFGFFAVNSIVLATSVIMERKGSSNWVGSLSAWEPFVWEISSSVMIVALIPMVAWVIDSNKFSWVNMWSNSRSFLIWSLIFSVLHVVGMVLIRELVYWLMGSNYSFGNWVHGFLYEYRKDAMTFCLMLIIVTGYRSTVQRLRGEASFVSQGEDNRRNSDRILVKKLGAEFVLKLDEIQWFESSGNYVNVHIHDRVYPVRSTMEKFIADIDERGFVRTHRSYGVNLDFVEAIDASPGQSGEVLLKNDRRIPLSKRYNSELRSSLQF